MFCESLRKSCVILLCLGFVLLSGDLHCSAAEDPQDIKAELEKRIDAWGKFLDEHLETSNLTGNKYYRDIVDMGIPALPYLMERIEAGNWALGGAVSLITEKRFEESEWPEGKLGDSISGAKLLREWWPKARKETSARFGKLYSEWKELKRQNKRDEAKNKLRQIRNLGVAALPDLIDTASQGERELVSVILALTKGNIDPKATVDECVSWWQSNKEKWLIPFPNKQPVSKAGQDQTAASGEAVELNGSGSTDADEDKLSYRWKQIAGPTVQLSDSKAALPRFTAPQVQKQTDLVFELIVEDGSRKKSVHPSCQSGESKPDTVKITVRTKE